MAVTVTITASALASSDGVPSTCGIPKKEKPRGWIHQYVHLRLTLREKEKGWLL